MSRRDDEREEMERRQRRRIGSAVSEYMREDEDFEKVRYDDEIDEDQIHIALDEIDSPVFDDHYDEDPYFDNIEELEADDSVTEEARRRIRKRLASGKRIQKNIHVASFTFIVIFLGMIVYLGYFLYNLRDDYLSNQYNLARQGVYSERYIRGSIYSSDGQILATTTEKDGKEVREYPFGNLFAHAVGYSTKGTTGVESIANSYLLGSHANVLTQIEKELKEEKIQGDTVVTTLDTRIQQAAYDALGSRKGAVIVQEVKTGKIIAMVSKPDFDPNYINDIWDDLVSDNTNSNLVNRATGGLYPPGSTFKILTALEYMRENPDSYENFSYNCSGSLKIEDYSIRCYGGTSHGSVSFESAFAESCNGAFATMGLSLEAQKFRELCESAGYNNDIDTNIPCATSKFQLSNDNDTTWNKLQTSIGQGDTLVTPLQNLLIVSAIANNGTAMKPYLIDHITSSEGYIVEKFESESGDKFMSTSEAQKLATMMRQVVTEGTGKSAEGSGYTVAGKTGSAEWNTDKETHAWFVGFAPYESPEIAISVIVEEGGAGGSVAAPVARAVFDAYFSR